MFGKLNKLRGKYNPAPRIRKYPNLQWLTVPENITKKEYKPFAGQRILTCAKCIKTLSKPARIKKKRPAQVETPAVEANTAKQPAPKVKVVKKTKPTKANKPVKKTTKPTKPAKSRA